MPKRSNQQYRHTPIILFTLVLGVLFSGTPRLFAQTQKKNPTPRQIQVGAERLDQYLPLLRNKKIGLVSNHTGVIGEHHRPLVDTLLALGIQVKRLFSPEHGFRGTANAGAQVQSGVDKPTGLPVISLYGNNKKPQPKQIRDLDLLLFDLQDVGCRFYTYISTMHYVMEAAAEVGVEVMILDRPNPNDYVDGPILTSPCRSFIGMHPIPVLHGLTVGELALMINGERWLAGGRQCNLSVVPIKGWRHGESYTPPIPPSPNLKNSDAIRLYPSLCFFEATLLSVGRGTHAPFTMLGYPSETLGNFSFIPRPMEGATDAKYQGQQCYGTDYTHAFPEGGLVLSPLMQWQQRMTKIGKKLIDRKRTFDLLAGTSALREQLEKGMTESEIRQSWQRGLNAYHTLRKKYIIYPDYSPRKKTDSLNQTLWQKEGSSLLASAPAAPKTLPLQCAKPSPKAM